MRIAVAVVFLMIVGCARRSDILFVDPALLSLVPADSVMLAGMKMEKIRETAAFKKYATSAMFKQPLDNFEKETGIDPRKDLWEILVASNGKGKSLVFARGSFAGTGLEPKIEKPGVTRDSYKGYMLFVKDDAGVVFLNSSTIAAGKTELLHEMIDARSTQPPAPKAFLDKLTAISRNNQAWVISLNGLPFPEVLMDGGSGSSNMTRNLLANMPRLLGSLQSSTAVMDFSNGLHLKMVAQCPTDKDAKTLHDTLRGGLGLARLQMPDKSPEMLRLIDAPLVTMSQTGVSLDLNYTLDDLELIASKFSDKK